MRIALHTRVRADRIAEYEAAHRAVPAGESGVPAGESGVPAGESGVPAELTAAIRAGGATAWTIWRSGTDLFHLIECADYPALLASLRDLPVNIEWQARMAGLLEVVHDYSADGAGSAGLPVVWQL